MFLEEAGTFSFYEITSNNIVYSETSQWRTLTGLKKLSVIERCPLLGGNLKKIVTFEIQRFVRYLWHVRYWEVLLYYLFI